MCISIALLYACVAGATIKLPDLVDVSMLFSSAHTLAVQRVIQLAVSASSAVSALRGPLELEVSEAAAACWTFTERTVQVQLCWGTA